MKNIRILSFLMVLGTEAVYGQFTETKVINRGFKVTPETHIEISNKYGKIDLNTWEKDSVAINIGIRVEEKKLSKLEETFGNIDFDFTCTEHFLIARTQLKAGRNPFEDEIQKIRETVLQTGGNIEINYTVWLPDKNYLKIENKFGNVFIDDYAGEVMLLLSNGNLKAHDLKGKMSMVLNFADANINSADQGRIEASYSDIYIKTAQSLQVISKSSTWEIPEIKNFVADSRRDKFRIRMVEVLDAKGSFTSFRINELLNKLNARIEYGDVDIEKISRDFTTIFIESKSADINLYFNQETSFEFDLTHTKSDLNLCREMKVTETKILDEKDKKTRITGSYGKKAPLKEKLFINSFAGEINIFTE